MVWAAAYLPVPVVVALEDLGDTTILLTEALPGPDATQPPGGTTCPRWCAPSAAGCGRSTTPSARSGAPSASTWRARLAHVEDRVAPRRHRPGGLPREHAHLTPAAALAELEATAPDDEDLVVCHGDFCPPNVLLAGRPGDRLRRPRRARRRRSLVGHRRRGRGASAGTSGRSSSRSSTRATASRPTPGASASSACSTTSSPERTRAISSPGPGEDGVEHRHGELAGEGVLLARVVGAEQGHAVRERGSRPGGRTSGAGAARSGRPTACQATCPRATTTTASRPAAPARGPDTARRRRARPGSACWPAARSARSP